MSETLEQRIRRVAKEDYALGKVTAFASDFVEYLDDRDATIATLTALLKEADKALKPFTHDDLCKTTSGQTKNDSPVFGRDYATLYLGDFRRAAEIRKKIQEVLS